MNESEIQQQIVEIADQNRRILDQLQQLQAVNDGEKLHVKIADANMPFLAMVGLLVKIALASIPALVILAVIFGLASLLFSGLLTALLIGSTATSITTPTASFIPTRSRVTASTLTVPRPQPTVSPGVTPLRAAPSPYTIGLTEITESVDSSTYVVQGHVRNRNTVQLSGIVAVVTFLNSDRIPILIVREPIDASSLDAGGVSTFTVKGQPSRGITSYVVDFLDGDGRQMRIIDTAP